MKFIRSSYNNETGISFVEIRHLGKTFIGEAHCHPEEKNPSSFAGCEYAEIRAEIKALKYERKILKNKSDMALDFVKSCGCYKNFDKESPTAKAIYRQLNKRIEKVNNITDEINKRIRALELKMKDREITIKAMERKKERDKKE